MAVSVTSNICSSMSSLSVIPNDKIRFKCVNQYDGEDIKRLYHADNLDVLN